MQCSEYENLVTLFFSPFPLAESSSAWGGGAHGLSDAFVAGFLWLDKLGVAARGGVEVVARQTLYQACYALLRPDLTPNPVSGSEEGKGKGERERGRWRVRGRGRAGRLVE